MAKDEKKEEGDGVICAVYKVNLHCRQCAREIQKPLKRCKGVQKIDADIEKGEITVTGKVDSKEIHTLIEKMSKKKVEVVSVKAFKKEGEKETEKVVVTTTVIKVQMHCEKCEHDLRRKIRKLKGVKSVITNRETQICTVESTIDQVTLTEYIRKKTRKHVEIQIQKEEVKKVVEVKGDDKGSKGKEDKSGEDGKEDLKFNEIPAPYFVHCTHAPQLFSDENPNACFVM